MFYPVIRENRMKVSKILLDKFYYPLDMESIQYIG